MVEPKFFAPADVARLLPWHPLIEAIEQTLDHPEATAPERTLHTVPVPDQADATLLLKPGWIAGDVIAVKTVTVFPNNGARNLPTINAGVLLFSGMDGTFLGACDGNELTTRRTAAASAVAAKRLAVADTTRLLVVGTGALAPMVAQGHAAVRPYETVEIWGRDRSKAAAVVTRLAGDGLVASVCDDLDRSVSAADVISCVTATTEPLVKGALLKPGAHVDLIGSFAPTMRESDDDVIRRARVWVDTKTDGVLAGDLAIPLQSGLVTMADIQGDLFDLISGASAGREGVEEITMFKSAGVALEDVAAAKLVFG